MLRWSVRNAIPRRRVLIERLQPVSAGDCQYRAALRRVAMQRPMRVRLCPVRRGLCARVQHRRQRWRNWRKRRDDGHRRREQRRNGGYWRNQRPVHPEHLSRLQLQSQGPCPLLYARRLVQLLVVQCRHRRLLHVNGLARGDALRTRHGTRGRSAAHGDARPQHWSDLRGPLSEQYGSARQKALTAAEGPAGARRPT